MRHVDVGNVLIRAAAGHLGCTEAEIRERQVSNYGPITRGRHVIWYVLRTQTGASNAQIGSLTGHDHSTVSTGISQAKKRLDRRDEFTRDILSVLLRALPDSPDVFDYRVSEARKLLDTAERLAPVIEALGHALAAMGERLSETIEEARAGLDAVDRVKRGVA